MKPYEYTEQEMRKFEEEFNLDPVTNNTSVYFYTNPNEDYIEEYIFESERMYPKICKNPTCLESIDLIELADELKQTYEGK